MRKKPPMDSVRLPKKPSYDENLYRKMEPFEKSSPKGRTPYSNEFGFALDKKGKLDLRAAPNSTVARVLGAKKSPYKSNIPAADVSKIRTTPTKRAGEPEILDVIRKERGKMRKEARDAVDRKRAVEYYERKMTPKQHAEAKRYSFYQEPDAMWAKGDAEAVAKELRKKDVTAARKAAMAPARPKTPPTAPKAPPAAPPAASAAPKAKSSMLSKAADMAKAAAKSPVVRGAAKGLARGLGPAGAAMTAYDLMSAAGERNTAGGKTPKPQPAPPPSQIRRSGPPPKMKPAASSDKIRRSGPYQ